MGTIYTLVEKDFFIPKEKVDVVVTILTQIKISEIGEHLLSDGKHALRVFGVDLTYDNQGNIINVESIWYKTYPPSYLAAIAGLVRSGSWMHWKGDDGIIFRMLFNGPGNTQYQRGKQEIVWGDASDTLY